MTVDRYTPMTTDELRALAARRGVPPYRIEGMVGETLRGYLRDLDDDEDDIARWEHE